MYSNPPRIGRRPLIADLVDISQMQDLCAQINFFTVRYIMNTIFVKEYEQVRRWYVIDAAGKPLGRVAAKAAAVVHGKNKATFTKNQNMGDYVVIINADKVAVSGGKEQKKIYYHHTGFVGGLKSHTFEKLIERHPTDPLRLAISGMLPHNRLGRALMDNVKIYAGAEHPHTAQNPQPLEV